MANEVTPPRYIDEMLRAAVEQSWKNPDTRRDLERIGINSEHELEDKLSSAIKDAAARSFDRAPDLRQGQTDRSTVVEAKITDQHKREHTLTVILKPERDGQGQIQGGDIRVDNRADRSGLSQELLKQYEKGQDPKVLMRGANLDRTEQQSIKSPVSRMDFSLGGLAKPTCEIEKQVDPKQQQAADLIAHKADITPVKPTLGQQGQDTPTATKREPTMIEKMQARQKEQATQQQPAPVQQRTQAATLNQGLSR